MSYKQLILSFIICHLSFSPAGAQTATQVLDKCAATVNLAEGATANFTMQSAQYGSAAGTIKVKGKKFHMMSNLTTMWFDGTTLWTYMASNDEVNISTPTSQQLQTLNPYNFVNLYKKNYAATLTTQTATYQVHLTATDGTQKIREAFLTIDKNSYQPQEIRLLVNNKWTTFTVSNMKAQKLSDAEFRFDSAQYPNAEIIDLR